MKTILCKLIARILFNQKNLNFLIYSGLNFEEGEEKPSFENIYDETHRLTEET